MKHSPFKENSLEYQLFASIDMLWKSYFDRSACRVLQSNKTAIALHIKCPNNHTRPQLSFAFRQRPETIRQVSDAMRTVRATQFYPTDMNKVVDGIQ